MDFESFKQLHIRFNEALEKGKFLHEEDQEAYFEALESNPKYSDWVLKQTMEEEGFDYSSFCCLTMAYNVSQSLDESGEILHDDVDVIINKWDDGSFGIPIHDGGSSIVKINFCPWCGTKLNNDE